MATLPSLSWLEIASALVMLGLVRLLPETLRTHLSARLQRGVVFEFSGKLAYASCLPTPPGLRRGLPESLPLAFKSRFTVCALSSNWG